MYYISSHTAEELEHVADVIRSYWEIENKVYWVLDVAYREDSCWIRLAGRLTLIMCAIPAVKSELLHYLNNLKSAAYLLYSRNLCNDWLNKRSKYQYFFLVSDYIRTWCRIAEAVSSSRLAKVLWYLECLFRQRIAVREIFIALTRSGSGLC